jgi:hypothetical protein
MPARWRGRPIGLAVMAPLALVLALTAAAGAPGAPILVVRGPDDRVLAQVVLPDGQFTLRYRNSLYRSTAEERFAIGPDGRMTLVGLAADELAVLEEYYVIGAPAQPAPVRAVRAWEAKPSDDVVLESLLVAATDLGRRTLLIEGYRPLELWRLVDDGAPSVHLEVVMP